MGGFAAAHQESIITLESEGICKLVCSCDPELSRCDSDMLKWEYSARGVRVFDDYLKMLDACKEELDFVIIPTPINLHARMHRAAIERGISVYLEKPPTLDCSELEEMLAVDNSAPKTTNVGFNFIIESTRQNLKQRLLDGAFGKLRRVELFGNWPRPDTYFERNNWAGKLMLGDSLVLDSIMGNAMAHYVHNVLFWAGKGELYSWPGVETVSAELYRANNIQGTDTVFLAVQTDTDIEIRIALSHACGGESYQYERLRCDDAIIDYVTYDKYTIKYNDGRIETAPADHKNLLVENLRHYCSYISGKEDRPITRLIDSIPFVYVNDLAYIAAGKITTIPEQYISQKQADAQNGIASEINDIETVCRIFVETGQFPTDQSAPWSVSGGTANRSEITRLSDVVKSMI